MRNLSRRQGAIDEAGDAEVSQEGAETLAHAGAGRSTQARHAPSEKNIEITRAESPQPIRALPIAEPLEKTIRGVPVLGEREH